MLWPVFFSSRDDLFNYSGQIQLKDCPYCQQCNTLVKHSKIYRTAKEKGQYIFHGQRIFCSNKKNKNGCGRTFSLNLTIKLPRFNKFTKEVYSFFKKFLETFIISVAWAFAYPQSFDINTPYRFTRLIQKSLGNCIASLLSITGIYQPPQRVKPNTLLYLISLMQHAFPNAENPLTALILKFQKRPF